MKFALVEDLVYTVQGIIDLVTSCDLVAMLQNTIFQFNSIASQQKSVKSANNLTKTTFAKSPEKVSNFFNP